MAGTAAAPAAEEPLAMVVDCKKKEPEVVFAAASTAVEPVAMDVAAEGARAADPFLAYMASPEALKIFKDGLAKKMLEEVASSAAGGAHRVEEDQAGNDVRPAKVLGRE